jgi:hypothetical protein
MTTSSTLQSTLPAPTRLRCPTFVSMPNSDESSQNPKRALTADFDEAPLSDLDSKKRRTAVASSSRGVATLTPEQLAKKRANDREAQRAIRERTKNQIEGLEKKIRELTSQQPYQELQHALREKDAIAAENADIKKRLASVLSLIQPILGQQGQLMSL